MLNFFWPLQKTNNFISKTSLPNVITQYSIVLFYFSGSAMLKIKDVLNLYKW